MAFIDDEEALKYLQSKGYTYLKEKNAIRAPTMRHIETQDEKIALDYLFSEWGYVDEPRSEWAPPEGANELKNGVRVITQTLVTLDNAALRTALMEFLHKRNILKHIKMEQFGIETWSTDEVKIVVWEGLYD